MKKPYVTWPLWLFVFTAGMALPADSLWAQDFEHITAEELKKLVESADKRTLIVDVQPKRVYDLGHIKGAVNFPWAQDLQGHGNLPKDKTLILYCDCGNEEDSADVAIQLREKWGYTDIKLLQGGWSKWQQLKFPMEK